VKEKEIQDELASIRSLMERSSKFISLSGLSGILAGIYALIGAAVAWYVTYNSMPDYYTTTSKNDDTAVLGLFYDSDFHGRFGINVSILIIALSVLIASIVSGFLLTRRKARQKGQPIWGKTSQSLLFHMATPLTTGAIVILIFIHRGYYGIVAPSSLIFYGLSLVSASNFTFTLVKYLGLCEIILGLIAACLPGYGLLFWAIGFGVLHIVYGSMMYFKYDR
jgi:general stress protein CsbA